MLEVLFYFQLVVGFIIASICLSIQFQEIPQLRRLFADARGVVSSAKIRLFRMVLILLVSAPSLFEFNEYYLMLFLGSVFLPAVGVIFPVAPPRRNW